jgi:hypothetical protein
MHSGIKKRIAGTLLSALVFASAAVGPFRSFDKALAADDYHSWRQMDERWGGVDMNGTTVAQSGCLITSLSIMAVCSGSLDDAALENLGISSPDEFDPGVLAEAYNSRGAFTGGGGIASWGTISQIIPSVTFIRDGYLEGQDQNSMAAEIKAMMDSGIHVILNVNWHHWVYVEGVVGDDIYMIDPAYGAGLVSDYYELSGGNEYWALTGSCPPGEFTAPPMHYSRGEHYYQGKNELPVYDSPYSGNRTGLSLRDGYVVNIGEICENYGAIYAPDGNVLGWVDVSKLTSARTAPYLESGDINGDGIVDMYDLSLLNEYLKTSAELPYGISVLRSCEAAAADINGDGMVDDGDVIEYLMKICG